MENGRREGASMSTESMPSERGDAVRCVVVAADAAYRARAETVLGELDGLVFALAAPTDPDEVWSLARREQAGVVVLDATGCESAVAGVIATLARVAPQLGVVVVCEHQTVASRELHALPKWGWTRELRDAVRRARRDGSPLVRPRALPRAGRREPLGPAALGAG